MDLTELIQTVGGIVSGFGFGMFTKSGRVKSQAEAHAAMVAAYEMQLKSQREGYEARLSALHKVADERNKTEVENAKRISELNHALNDKTERIRKLTDDVYDSQKEVNRVQDMLNDANARITELTEELAARNLDAERLENIRCHRYDCSDRLPPELVEKLKNLPQREVSAGYK